MLNRFLILAIAAMAMAFASIVPASAETRTFHNPMQGSNRLDWCYNWGVGCGKQAADAWCKAQGYADGATLFSEAQNIGAQHPTRLIGTGAVCDQGYCDGFTAITCSRHRPTTVRFHNPMQGGNRLDWCYNWGVGCGKQAADTWCKAKGFAGGAVNFQEAQNIGAQHPTRLIGTGAVCDQGYCDGFSFIACQH